MAMLTRRWMLGAAAALPATVMAADELPGGGPLYLLISYRCAAADRPAFRAYWQNASQFDALMTSGQLKSWQVLFNPVVDGDTWDAMAILGFTSFAATKAWHEIERTAPGGLSADGLKLARPLDTIAADLQWSGSAKGAEKQTDSVYYVIPYEYAAADQYRKYVDGYVIPQVKGWMAEGVLSGYRIFMNRYPVGRKWDSLFVYQYRNLTSFGRRDETVAKVRRTLVDDPVWKNYHEIKKDIRSEAENTIAELLKSGAAK